MTTVTLRINAEAQPLITAAEQSTAALNKSGQAARQMGEGYTRGLSGIERAAQAAAAGVGLTRTQTAALQATVNSTTASVRDLGSTSSGRVLTDQLSAARNAAADLARQLVSVQAQLSRTGQNSQLLQATDGLEAVAAGLGDLGNAANDAEDGLDQTTESAVNLRETLAGLRELATNVIGVAIGVGIAGEIAAISDEYTNLTSKLRLVTDSEQQLARVRTDLFDVSQRTRADAAATAELYTRLTRATADLGLVESQRLLITETINKALVVSGATAQEGSAAIIQFSQALASGVLRGEEFNSISEQAPILLDMLGKALGKTRGELRAMAAEGELTSDVLVNSLLAGADDVANQFDSMALTIGGAGTQLANAFKLWIGEGANALGVSTLVAVGISGLAAVFGPLADVIGLVAVAWGVKYVTAAVAARAAGAAQRLLAIELTAAQLREAVAAEAAAAAQLAHARVLQTAGVISSAQMTAALNALAVAQGRVTAATVASTAAQVANTGILARFGSGLAALVGGPIGLAVIGIGGLVLGINALLNSAAASEAELDRMIEQMEVGAGAAREMANSLTEAAEAPTALAASIAQFQDNVRLISQAAVSVAEAQAKVDGLVRSSQQRLLGDLNFDKLDEARERVAELESELKTLQGGTEELGTALLTRFAPAVDAASFALANLAAQSTAIGSFNALRDGITSVLGAINLINSSDVDAQKLFAEISAGAEDSAEKLKTAGKSAVEVAEGLVQLAIAKAEDANWTEQQIAGLRASGAAYVSNLQAIDAAKNATRDLSASKRDAARAEREREQEERKARREIGEAIKAEERRLEALNRTRVSIEELTAQLAGPVAQAELEYGRAVEESIQALFRGESTREQAIQLLDLHARAHERNMRAAQAEAREQSLNADVVSRALDGLREEVSLLGLTADQREAVAIITEAQARAREQEAQGQRESIELTNQELGLLREEIELLQQKRNAADFDFTRALSEGVNVAFRTGSVSAGFRSFIQAFTAALSGGIESAVGAIAGGLSFASDVANAYRNSDGNGVGSALREVNSQLAASGNVFAQAAAAIDSLFKGRLFGTDYEKERSGFDVSFSGAGVTGYQFLQESRQRSLFRGTARRTTNEDLDAGTEQTLADFFDSVLDAMALGALALGVQVPDLISGAFREVTDKNGKVIEQFGTILGRQFSETFDKFQQRLVAENILAVIDQLFRVPTSSVTQPIVGGGGGFGDVDAGGGGGGGGRDTPGIVRIKSVEAYTGEASAIAERWRADASVLLDGAKFLLSAATDIRAGIGLLGDEGGLTAIANLIGDLQGPGETLEATYTRVAGATQLLDRATALMGLSLEGSRESFVRAASDIASAAGGLDRATGLWNSYFETFYSDSERAALRLSEAQQRRDDQLTALGLSSDISLTDFRTRFEAEFPNLTAEQRVQWLEAGEAIRITSDAQTAYNEALAAADEPARLAREAILGVLDSLTGFAADLDRSFVELERAGLTDFQRQMLAVDDGLQDNVARLLSWRRELEASGASAEELARVDALLGRVHLLAAQQSAAAINALRDAGRGLVDQLNGVTATELTGAAQQLGSAGTGAFQEIGGAIDDVMSRWMRGLESVQAFLDRQLLGDLTSLTPAQQFAEAQRQFNQAVAAANAGDPEALDESVRLAEVLLQLGRDRFAAGQQFTDLEASVRAALTGLLGVRPAGGDGGSVGGVSGPGTGFSAPLEGAVGEFGQQAAANRLELAQQLTVIVRDLMQATSTSLAAVTESIGLDLSVLVGALGVNLSELSAATTVNLGEIANSLGVELSDLASNLGVDLGALADSQSLINQAMEAAIAALPEGQRDRLQPLLDDLEEASRTGGPDKINAAILALESETRRIGGAAALALAPYLDGIDPTDPLVEIDGVLRAGFADASFLLSAVKAGVQALVRLSTPLPDPVPAPTGTTAGEPVVAGKSIVVQAPIILAESVSTAGTPSAAAAQDSQALLREVKGLREELARLSNTVASGDAANVAATRDAGTEQRRAIDEQTRVMSSNRTFAGA